MTRAPFLGALFALALALGCAHPDSGDEPALDEVTMAFLGTVRALHHEADVFESTGDHARAAQSIRRILALEFPRGMRESQELRADAYGRLGEIALRVGDPDQALSLANTGLADARRETVFRARLFVVRGQALGMLADRAVTASDPEAARRRRAEALDSLEMSIQINQRVLGRLTDAGRR